MPWRLLPVKTPKGRSGFALSMLSTAQISGFLCGPLLGGYLADHIGLRPVFFVHHWAVGNQYIGDGVLL